MNQRLEYIRLGTGDPAPWFTQRSYSNPEYRFDTAAGRYIVMGFFASAGSPGGQEALEVIRQNRALFDDKHLAFFGISIDAGDEAQKRVHEEMPGLRYFWDFDLAVSKLYGSVARNFSPADGRVVARRIWYVLDPTMRIMAAIPMDSNPNHGAELIAFLKALPPVEKFAGIELQAPVIYLPNVFEPELCQRLIDIYEDQGGVESGFMRDVGGKTVGIVDYGLKRRSDVVLTDETLLAELRARLKKRLVPEIEKIHFFHATRIERFIVACYDGAHGGFFRPHRDHTTKGTAHRRFAVTINLNNDFEGGELNFPEYGPRTFKPPPGGAVVFSCALLHAVTPVTKGKRYAFLPFLYDEAAAKIRAENQQFLEANATSAAATKA
ncbi:MAG TPA: 2OG-Fe(II) oxygenase [Patescibacteria group bacterium]|nr:2OG-Fe(II) oxygenase [Patescibacteria group bacterium]